jgi:hypothetical protein
MLWSAFFFVNYFLLFRFLYLFWLVFAVRDWLLLLISGVGFCSFLIQRALFLHLWIFLSQNLLNACFWWFILDFKNDWWSILSECMVKCRLLLCFLVFIIVGESFFWLSNMLFSLLGFAGVTFNFHATKEFFLSVIWT